MPSTSKEDALTSALSAFPPEAYQTEVYATSVSALFVVNSLNNNCGSDNKKASRCDILVETGNYFPDPDPGQLLLTNYALVAQVSQFLFFSYNMTQIY